MESSGISKKEYLKKYLSGGEKDKKKKKKKSTQSLIIKSKIVDDDIDLKNMRPVDEDELDIYDLAEEAPQIAGIVDERPEEVRLMSEFRSTKKWKIVTDEYGIEDVKITAIDRRKESDGSPRVEKEISIEITKKSDRKGSDSDESPPRRKEKENRDVDFSSVKVKKEVDSDASPPRKSRKANYDSDASPPRRPIKKEKISSGRKRADKDDSDASPPRKSRKDNYDSDPSPPRRVIKKEKDSDSSPPRRRQEKPDSDTSPPRRRHRHDSDSSPPRRKPDSRSRNHGRESDRRRDRSSEGRRKKRAVTPTVEEYGRKDQSKKNGEYGLKVSTSHENESKKEKKSSQLEKTLSGKKAGLQSAEEMRKESEKLRQKEKETFEKMSDEVTGRHATAVVRDRKTGRLRDPKEEARKKREKEEKEAEKIAQYAVWGKGVKQVKDREDKIKSDLYEMSKPLARYKDDKDLEEMLRNQEREGDPMLEYIRRKKQTESGPAKPQYEGNYMPNRYGIRPGHKWDGVDRSNGYEKKWFEEQNAKKAREEEAFKWSTIDM